MAEKVSRKVAPKLARSRAAEGRKSGLRAEVAELNETIDELAAEAVEVKRAVRDARERRGEDGGKEIRS